MKEGHCYFKGYGLGLYPFCDPEKTNCQCLLCPYWIEPGGVNEKRLAFSKEEIR